MLGITLDSDAINALLQHIRLLVKWNQTYNLTSITEPDKMVVQHILDSLAMHSYIKGKRLLDVGTGGGFPGLPLAVTHPGLGVTLLDSRGKRVQFLRHVIGRLGITNVELENCRMESYQPGLKFDTLTARAFTSLTDMVQLCQSCLQSGTRLVAMKGVVPDGEIRQLEADHGSDTPFDDIEVIKLQVPFMSAERHLVIIDF